jgi:hypothetical protein
VRKCDSHVPVSVDSLGFLMSRAPSEQRIDRYPERAPVGAADRSMIHENRGETPKKADLEPKNASIRRFSGVFLSF